MRAYQGRFPAPAWPCCRGGMPIVAACVRFCRSGKPGRSHDRNQLPSRVDDQAIHRGRSIAACRKHGRLSIDDPRAQMAADAAAARGWNDHSASAHPHLGTHRLRGLDSAARPRNCTTPMCSGCSERKIAAISRRAASYRYSNSGYSLLALIVDRASGEDFASFLRHRIFLPLGMQNTVAFEAGISTVAHRAYGYSAGLRIVDAHRSESDERDARRRGHLFLDRRPRQMGGGAVR